MQKFRDVFISAEKLLKNMPDPIFLIDLDDRIIWVNDAFRNLFSYSADQLNCTATNFIAQLRSGSYEEQQSKWHYEGKIPICNVDDETIAYTVQLKECTFEKQAEEDYDKYRIIAENTSDTIVLVDNKAIFHYVSPSIESLLGYKVEQYEKMNVLDVIHPDDRAHVRVAHEEAFRTELPINLEFRLINAQSHAVYIEAQIMRVMNSQAYANCIVVVARDVTQRKNKDRLLENILDNINVAVWSTDKDFTRMTFCSESIRKFSGLSNKEIMSKPILIHNHIHPDDNERLFNEVKHQLDQGIPVVNTFRFTQAAKMRWMKMTIHPYLDHKGAIERIDGIMMDITDKKLSELAVEESEQRYKSLFEHNLDGVFSIELGNFTFVKVNKSFELITGIRFNQPMACSFKDLIVDEDHAVVYETVLEVMQRREPRDIECMINRSQHGEKIVSITFVPIFIFGELNGIHGIVKDITQQKKEEKELIESQARYKLLQQSINRFSNDLTNVMKVSELENRLIDEVRTILHVSRVSIEEVERGQEHLMNMHDIWIKIGERHQPVYLRISTDESLLKIEQEWLETVVHYATILYDNLHLIEDLMKRLEEMVTKDETPKWMLRLLFRLSEKERSSLSSDLHDSVLQDLIIWYRKLESLRSSAKFANETQIQLKQIEEGLLDAIHQIRITCNELRPPFLLKMGLVESLKSLFSYTRMFSNYEIEFSAEELNCSLHEDQILGIYRIVQELLNNATKHSHATKVAMALACKQDTFYFYYSDDGVGMDLSALQGSFTHMGIAGIEKRVFSIEGEVEFKSSPHKGFHVTISCPINTQLKGERYGNFIS